MTKTKTTAVKSKTFINESFQSAVSIKEINALFIKEAAKGKEFMLMKQEMII